jgi:hypothetical protein
MIKKGKWSVPGYRVSSRRILREWTLRRLLRLIGEVRRVLSHVNGWRSIRRAVLDVGSESFAIKGGGRLYLMRRGWTRTQSDEMKTWKTNHCKLYMSATSFASSRCGSGNPLKIIQFWNNASISYNRISNTLTLLSSEQLASCNPSLVFRHASLLI